MKHLIITLLLGCIAFGSYGQFYVQPSVGYSFSSHPDEIRSTFITDNQKSVYVMKLRWSENMNAGLTLGYELWDQLFFELNARIAVYSSHKASIDQPDLSSLDNFYIAGFFGEYEYSSPVFQFAPQIGYRVRRDKLSASFSLGPNFMKTKVQLTSRSVAYEFLNWELPLDKVVKYEYIGGLHTGIQADLGFCYSIRPELQLVLDFVTTYNNYKITKGEITQYEIDGTDRMGTLQDTDIEIDPDDNKLNHSYYGINIGLRYVFGRRDQNL